MDGLTPFRLAPYFRTRIWGFNDLSPWFDYKTDGEPIGEVWLTGEMCTADTGPLKGQSLEEITAAHGDALLGDGRAGEAVSSAHQDPFSEGKAQRAGAS